MVRFGSVAAHSRSCSQGGIITRLMTVSVMLVVEEKFDRDP